MKVFFRARGEGVGVLRGPVRPSRDLLLLCIFLSASVSGVANDEFELRKPAGFFRVDPGAELTTAERRQGVLVYRASSGTWTARSSAPGQVVITDTVRPGVVFEYQNGRLVRFRAAADQPVWRLDYCGDQLRGMRADGESQLAIELIRQRGIGPVEEIRVGKRRFRVDFGRATIHAPDGLTAAAVSGCRSMKTTHSCSTTDQGERSHSSQSSATDGLSPILIFRRFR